MKLKALFLLLIGSTIYAQSPTFGYMALGRVNGKQNISIPDHDLKLSNPYRIDYTIEGHYMLDDFYFIGKVFNSIWGEYDYDYQGASYEISNGSVISFSLGAFSEKSDRLGLGFGFRNDYTYYGLSNFSGGKVEAFSWLVGPEVPVTFALNDFMRLYGKVALMNVWNDKVFNGFSSDINIDLHFTPFSFLLIGGGLGYNTMFTNSDFAAIEDDISYNAHALYYQFYIGVSLGHAQEY